MEEEKTRQQTGYVEFRDYSRELPSDEPVEFQERVSGLTPKQKRLITPLLHVSIFDHQRQREESFQIPIEEIQPLPFER